MMKNLRVGISCPFCTKPHFVAVNDVAYANWQNGELIQKAMPDLTPTERTVDFSLVPILSR